MGGRGVEGGGRPKITKIISWGRVVNNKYQIASNLGGIIVT